MSIEGTTTPTISTEEKLLAELNDKLDVLIKVVSVQVGADKTVTERAGS